MWVAPTTNFTLSYPILVAALTLLGRVSQRKVAVKTKKIEKLGVAITTRVMSLLSTA